MYNRPKTPSEQQAIRESGRMLANVLQAVGAAANEGTTGTYIDELARKELKAIGGVPAFLGYQGFPGSICISINDAVVHGIPSDYEFKNGDVIGFDFGVVFRGMITDAARTVIIGDSADKAVLQLVETTKWALDNAIAAVKNNASIGDISAAAQATLEEGKFGIVRDLVGHGVGHEVHEGPEIPNYGTKGTGPKLKSGMTIAIEPMATLGDYRVVMDPDGWTIRTRDGSTAAHFEDTVLVTDSGAEILTRL